MTPTPKPWTMGPNDFNCVGRTDDVTTIEIDATPGLLEAAKAILAKEYLLTTSAAYLEYRALEAAVAKAEGRE